MQKRIIWALFLLPLILLLTPLYLSAQTTTGNSTCACPTGYPEVVLNTATGELETVHRQSQDSLSALNSTTSEIVQLTQNDVQTDSGTQRIGRVRRGNVTLYGYMIGDNVYVVGGGDVLWRVAYVFGTTVNQLALTNALTNADRIERGQRLSVVLPADYRPPQATTATLANRPAAATSVNPHNLVTCGGCGLELSGRYNFCPVCGTPMGVVNPAAPAPAPAAPPTP